MKIRGYITKTRDGKWYIPTVTVTINGKEKQYFKGNRHVMLYNARYEMRILKRYAELKTKLDRDAIAEKPMMTPKAHGLWARVKAAVFGAMA